MHKIDTNFDENIGMVSAHTLFSSHRPEPMDCGVSRVVTELAIYSIDLCLNPAEIN